MEKRNKVSLVYLKLIETFNWPFLATHYYITDFCSICQDWHQFDTNPGNQYTCILINLTLLVVVVSLMSILALYSLVTSILALYLV